ncbi:MAG: hypothetical protein ONB48_03905 [candidate division KSB1 bacterium]|nr:hypothetical protein [candidate division KSB1 bacterium]MDZ7274545.1 hypothetical protein [candidate division KSB1 bacterium]MDZ7284794.1 hypothetical protein [candidate division KSB1 bacterium]MDZ7297786.1 hypothetical protein [candidate division KSB1 bacterium]MDZ7306425.1 hypothetical protein [candidate division KSB1 bacterium]
MNLKPVTLAVLCSFWLPLPVVAQSPGDTTAIARTCLRVAAGQPAALASQVQAVLLSNADDTFLPAAQRWRAQGVQVYFNLVLNRGPYQDYVLGTWDGTPHPGEYQLAAPESSNPELFPTPAFLHYLEAKITHALNCGAAAVILDDPAFLPGADSSAAFQRVWQEATASPWQNPSQSASLRYAMSKHQQRLYWEALVRLFAHAKKRAQETNREVACYLATPSLLTNSRRGAVGPATRGLHIPDCDGLLARVGPEALTAASRYAGVVAVRPFENALLEYGLFANQVRGHDKQLWLQINPFEGSTSISMAEAESRLRAQVAAALFYPAHWQYELPGVAAAGSHAPADSASRLLQMMLIIAHALGNMRQPETAHEAAEHGVGILLSESMLLQRAAPAPADSLLSFFYGLALPLLKHGVFIQPLVMENLHLPQYLTGCKVIFLSYSFMKPQDHEWHERLSNWVRAGGTLIFIDAGNDPFNRVTEWWRRGMFDYVQPAEHLFETLKLGYWPKPGRNPVGMGSFIYLTEDPAGYAQKKESARYLLQLAGAALPAGRKIIPQNYLRLRRGPYLVAATFAETADTSAQILAGDFIDLFDPQLPRCRQIRVAPGGQALLFDLAKLDSAAAHVLAASAAITQERRQQGEFSFVVKGPAGRQARVLVFAPAPQVQVTASHAGAPVTLTSTHDGMLHWLVFEHQAQGVAVRLHWKAGGN